jgi:uncharacterized protein Yka (UPF0111/DUF47 family)
MGTILEQATSMWKDIYDDMENVLDACEDVANIIEGVVMKNT